MASRHAVDHLARCHLLSNALAAETACPLRAGPEGTPYEAGCFVFDLFFPQQYPAVPPLMHFDTNGQGRVRMNPNLYADGKV